MNNATTIPLHILRDLEEALHITDEFLIEDVTLRTDYGYRHGMGATCIGFTCDDAGDLRVALMDVAAQADDPDLAEAARLLARNRPDVESMGMGVIVYWPGFVVEEEEA